MCRLLLAATLILAACAHQVPPSPPPAFTSYLAPDAVDLTQLLPPPPAAGSAAERKELDMLEAYQRTRTAARFALARADAHISYDSFGKILGSGFVPDKLPLTMKFLSQVGRSTGLSILIAKDCYERVRPFVTDQKLRPTDDLLRSAGMPPASASSAPLVQTPQGPGSPCLPPKAETGYSFSYPSGHSTFGAMTAILLSQMVPEKRDALFERGWDYGESRLVGTVHYPSDVESARIEAAVLVAAMMQNPQFKADLAAARTELRAALGLPE